LPTMGCEAAPNPATSASPDTPHPPVLLPLRARSRGKRRSYGLRPESKACITADPLLPEECRERPAHPLMPGGRRSLACRRWAAQRPQIRPPRLRLTHRIQRFYCRCAPDRGTSDAPTAFGQNQKPSSPQIRFCPRSVGNVPHTRLCPEGVGVWLADDGLRSGPKTRVLGMSDTPHPPVLLPLRARSSGCGPEPSDAPTAFGQNQKPVSPQIRFCPRSVGNVPHTRFCPEGVGVRLADDGLRSGPKP